MTSRTPLQTLVEERLGEPLHDFINRHRAPEPRPLPGKSWRSLAAEITDLTGVTVTHETLRLWATRPEADSLPNRAGLGGAA